MEINKIDILEGKTILRIKREEDSILFFLSDLSVVVMEHPQDCCESVYIEDIEGALDDLIGVPLIKAEEITYEDETPGGIELPDDSDYSYTWTFYKFATIKGYVTIRWFGTSNGYYSEQVDVYVSQRDMFETFEKSRDYNKNLRNKLDQAVNLLYKVSETLFKSEIPPKYNINDNPYGRWKIISEPEVVSRQRYTDSASIDFENLKLTDMFYYCYKVKRGYYVYDEAEYNIDNKSIGIRTMSSGFA